MNAPESPEEVTAVQTVEPQPTQIADRYSPQEIVAQMEAIKGLMSVAMTKGVHYGVIPGCGDKPTLLKPGAEKLSLLFRLAPHYTDTGASITRLELPEGHREYEVVCVLVNIPTGQVFAGRWFLLIDGIEIPIPWQRSYQYW